LLAKLLKHLRETKNIMLLTICRQINKLKIKNNVVVFDANEDVLEEIRQNQEYFMELKVFFDKENLSIDLGQIKKELPKSETLKIWLGEKLKII